MASRGALRFRAADLLWRPAGILLRFVVVHHPCRGVILLMCTDRTLSPLDIIRISQAYREAVRRKIAAYHRHIQLGLIAQGLLQILSAAKPKLVWRSFGSWIRTLRPGLAPSEQVVAFALRNTLPEFLASAAKTLSKGFALEIPGGTWESEARSQNGRANSPIEAAAVGIMLG